MFAYLLAAASMTVAFEAEMTSHELDQTGITKLSIQEKMALQEWIENHYGKKVVVANKKAPPTLQENLKSGRYIRLTDNSLWEINPEDTPITQGWITPVEIKVEMTGDGAYPYKLTNTLTGSSVRARKAQKVESTPTQPSPIKKNK